MRLALLLGVPLLFFVALEVGLRVIGFGHRTDFFIPDETKPGTYCANPEFTSLFLPPHFGIRPLNFRLKPHKEPGSVRIFVLGESAAQGTPDPGFGFAAQLQAKLSARYAGRKIEVINLGITAINSHVVYQVARELPDFEPDLFVIYMGNNEVIGPYGPGSAYLSTMPPLWAIRASVWARSLRTGQLLARLLARSGNAAGKLEWRGMETFTKDTVRGNDPRLADVYANLESNLRDILAIAGKSGAPCVVSTVVANLKDSAPFVSLHRAGLGGPDLAAWQAAFDDGWLSWQLGETVRAEGQLTKALQLDAEYADTHFLLGRIADARGDTLTARRHFLDALHWDALRFRPDPRVNEIIRRVARSAGSSVHLVDAALELGSDPGSAAPPCGQELLFEHVHFNWAGNARVSQLLAEACAPLLPFAPTSATWPTPAQTAAALGYTEYGYLTMLGTISDLTGKPPFTNQLTYGEYQTRLQAETSRTRSAVMTTPAMQATAAELAAALRANPQDPALMIRLENVEFDLRHYERALELVDQAMALQPRSAVLITQRANLLLLLNRPNEAEEILLSATHTDPYYFPSWQVLVAVWGKTGQIDKGRRLLEDRLKEMPTNNYIRTAYAALLMRSGQTAAGEEQWRNILATDPSSMVALEQLVRLCVQTGRSAEADSLMREGFKAQPRNAANNRRLAQGFAAQGDFPNMVVHLRLLAESGGAEASLVLELAQRLADLGREREALLYARRGQQQATAEGNATLEGAATALLRRLDRR